jgi:hypothetical protein
VQKRARFPEEKELPQTTAAAQVQQQRLSGCQEEGSEGCRSKKVVHICQSPGSNR